jgi:hypothetical protein
VGNFASELEWFGGARANRQKRETCQRYGFSGSHGDTTPVVDKSRG